MSRISQPTAHRLADESRNRNFNVFVAEQHTDIERLARQGLYVKTVVVPASLVHRIFEITTYFSRYHFNVTLSNNVITITW